MSIQPSLFPEALAQTPTPAPACAMPPGFRYRPDLITPQEEAELATQIADLDLKPFEFRGYLGFRRTRSFGYRYDYTRRAVDTVEHLPDVLRPLRARVAAFAGLQADDFSQVLVTEYAPGAPIGWHRDKPQFDIVAGVSLLSPASFRLRRTGAGGGWERRSQVLQPRSAYIMAGEVRRDWEHSIPPLETLRYSVTFRTLAEDFAAQLAQAG